MKNIARIALVALAAFAAAPASAADIVWKGGVDTSWDTAGNWDPEQVPGASDDVVVSKASAKVYAPAGIAVNSLSVSGSGVELHLGDATARTPWTATVADDLAVSGGAKLYAYAAALADTSVFANRDQAIAAIYANATEVTVGGTFSVSGGATVLPSNDPYTATPVIFQVGDFNLAADGSFDTKRLGWRWVQTTPAGGAPAGATATANGGYTFAFGVGSSYGIGAGYGGYGAFHNATYGLTYGTSFAPFLPGSHSGWYAAGNWSKIIAPGSIVVFAQGTASIAGTMDASGEKREYGGCSGGSIWVSAGTLSVSPQARLLAPAEPQIHQHYKGGGGGRIALVENVTRTEIDALAAASSLPAGYISRDIVECEANVNGAASGVGEPLLGTAVYVTHCGAGLSLDTRSSIDVVAEGISFFVVPLQDGVAYSAAAPAYGYAAADPGYARYACQGHILSNATAQVVASASPTLSFVPSAAAGPYSATWLWGGRENKFVVDASGQGSATLPGGVTESWFAEGSPVTLTATPDSGYRFVCWLGDFPGGRTNEATFVFTPTRGGRATAVFAAEDGATAAKAWTGGAGTALWDDAGNWSPSGVPTADDAVTIASATVYAPRGAVAASLTLGSAAKLFVSATGTSVAAAPQDESEHASTRYLFVAGDLSSAGTLVLGGIGDAVARFVFDIGGDMTLSGTSQTAIYAARGVGAVDTAALLFAKRTDFAVGGDLTLSDTAVLYPVADPLTGTAVLVTADDFSVAAGASVSAKGLGYDGVVCPDGVADSRAVTTFTRASLGTGANELRQVFGPGPGFSYNIGAGHGGASAKASGIYGRSYGLAHAPVFCGSPSGYLNTYSAGGGVVWLRARGTFTANGAFSAEAAAVANSGASGGSIWLLARAFSFGADVQLLAPGGNGGYNDGGSSGGGRISVATGFTDAALAEIVTLASPTEDYLVTELTECPYSVEGGVGGNTTHGFVGTATRVSYIGNGTTLVQLPSEPVVADGLAFVQTAVNDGDAVSITAPEYGYLEDRPDCVRYTCTGVVVSNAVGEVMRSATRTCSYVVDAAQGPYTNVWLWTGREERFRAEVSGDGAATVNGASALDVWLPAGSTVSLAASPSAGHRFVCWLGDVPGGKAATPSLAFTPAVGSRATAVFARGDGVTAAKVWTGGAGTTAWDDAANWDPAGVPTADDDVAIASGTVYAPRGIVAGSSGALTLASTWATAAASTADAEQDAGDHGNVRFLFVAGDVANAGSLILGGSGDAVPRFVFEIGGNLALSGTSQTAVYAARTAGPVDAASLFAARTDFAVGGTLSLSDTAVLYTVCDPLTGTAVRLAPGNLAVAAGTTLSSDARGWFWCRCPDGTAASKDPRARFTVTAVTIATNLRDIYQSFAPGTGQEYWQGAGHGGRGGYFSTLAATYGLSYGWELAPFLPGSPNGIYGAVLSRSARGGGVVWVETAGTAEIAGTVTACQTKNVIYGGASGGGIWICAGRLALSAGATFQATGANSNYNAQGAGGRIALARGLSAARVEALGETGATTLPARRILDETAFAAIFPGVTVNVSPGGGERAQPGTFRFLDGLNPATVMVVR